MRHSVFYPVVVGFIVGIFIRSYTTISLDIFYVLLVITISLLAFCIHTQSIYTHKEIKTYSLIFLSLVSLAAFVCGIARYNFFIQDHGDESLKSLIGKKVELEGVVVEEPDERDTHINLIVKVFSYRDRETHQKVLLKNPTKILASDSLYSHITYGDEIELQDTLDQPENFLENNGTEFDYVDYLAKDKIFYMLKQPTISLIQHHQGNRIKEYLFFLKNAFIQKLDASIPFPDSRFAAGITIAGKRALPQTLQDEFQKSGTLQVIVLSGYNITIVAEMIACMFSFLSKKVSGILSIISIILFVIMAGGASTVIRGGVMASILIIGQLTRRRYDVTRALIVTGVCMIIINPMVLVFDASFDLSFLATLGLIFLSPLLTHYFMWVPEKFKLREMYISTCAAQIFVMPFLIGSSGDLNMIAMIANIAVSLLIPITMLICFTTGIIGFVSPILALPSAWVAFIFLSYELGVVHFFSSLPFGSITLAYFPSWCVALCYLGYAVFIWRYTQHETRKRPTILEIKKP